MKDTKKFNGKLKQAGFTLIELLIGLAVIGIAIIAIVGTSRTASDSSKVQTELKNLQTIQQAVKASFGSSGNYTGLTAGVALKAGAYPSQMVGGTDPDTSVKNGWSGIVTTVVNGTDASTYDINYGAIPSASCINLVSQVLANFKSVKIGATSKASSAWTVGDITTSCSTASTADVVFTGA